VDLATGSPLAGVNRAENALRTVAFAPDGEILACGGTDGSITLLDVRSGKIIHRFGVPISGVHISAVDPTGTIAAIARDGHLLEVFDLARGQLIFQLETHSTPHIAFMSTTALAIQDGQDVSLCDISQDYRRS